MISSINHLTSSTLQKNSIENAVPSSNSFKNILEQSTNSLLEQLQSKFGTKISIQNFDFSKNNIDKIGNSTSGTGNVIIASNILEKMASNPQTKEHYEQKIQAHFDTNFEASAFMAMNGREIVSRGVVIHPNGEVTYYSSSDYTPQEKARLEKAMKEEDEAKAKKRADIKNLNEEIAFKQYEQLNSYYNNLKYDVVSSNNPKDILNFLNN